MFTQRILTTAALYSLGGLFVFLTVKSTAAQDTEVAPVRVLFLGNSLTAGYGLSINGAYPALLQNYADSLHWRVIMVNAGVSGDTSAGGLSRLGWQLETPSDILVIALGSNDGLRGLSPSMTKKNLIEIILQARASKSDIDILIAGMQVPPNMGPTFQDEFRGIFATIAEEMDVTLIPFLLEGVGGVRELIQSDGVHPNLAGQQKLAENVWIFLSPILERYISKQ
ncbi:MAG: arylesterase [Bacteroidetes bacterium]|nr:arylesterase [Bacteroidota bacterium]